MLILTRQWNEKVYIDVPASAEARRIELIVVDISGDKVKVGFKADRDVSILRDDAVDKRAKETIPD